MDMCNVSVICPCKSSVETSIVRLGIKSFDDVLKEVKTCPCMFVSAAGKVDRADKWTDIARDVVSTPNKHLGSIVSNVMSLFQFKYLVLKCSPVPECVFSTAENRPTETPSAFVMLFRAQQLTHLPPPKVPLTKKDELRNDILKSLRTRRVGFSVPESTNQGSYLLTVSEL